VIVKTIRNIDSKMGCVVSGASFRAQREGIGFKVNSGEFKGLFIPSEAAIVLSDIVLDDEGRIPRGKRYA
jgi:predicted membrane protein